ncbi:MAG: hypothetical protein ACQEUZ_10530 [Pseudomonadota bacterium]
MSAPPVLRPTHSHLFAGCRLRLDAPLAPPPEGEDVILEFSDGVAAPARLSPMAGRRLRLEVAPHVTDKGTRMHARSWLLENLTDDPLALRVRQSGE